MGYSSIAFATSDIKENLSQLDQKTIVEKMNYGITDFTLKVLELGEDIPIRKTKLSNIDNRAWFRFLKNELNKFKDKLYKNLEKNLKKLNKVSPPLTELTNT